MFKSFFIPAVALLAACGGQPQKDERRQAEGGRVYGGTLKLNETDRFVSLYPHLVTDAISQNITTQLYDGLVRYDNKNTTKIVPCIAESWDIDSSGTVYTFRLRKGVMFHDDPCFSDGKGREVKAADVLYSFRMLCTAGDNNGLFDYSFKGKVAGADEFYELSKVGKQSNLDGIKAPDDYTVQIRLKAPASTFLYILASPSGYIFPKEAVEKYADKSSVGTGPFRVASISDDKIILTRHPGYFRTDSLGNRLPFLDTLLIHSIASKAKELEAFKKEETHIIFGMPAASITEMVEESIKDFSSKNPKYILYRNPELSTEYYQFSVVKPPFDKVKVRKAFAYAIDRDKIIADVLNTEAFGPGICGITPPGISEYDITSIVGYNFNPEKAKKLLAEAGYPDGKNFPRATIEVNSGGGKHTNVVEEVKKQLKEVLNVNVDFTVVPFSRKLEDARYSRAEIFRSGWVADYPSPESFLRIFYGAYVPDSLDEPSYPNSSRYKNPAFDSLFEKGFMERDRLKGFEYFRQAEQIMMDESPAIMLWYGETMKLIHTFVKNFYFNPINYKDYSEVYIQRNPPAAKP